MNRFDIRKILTGPVKNAEAGFSVLEVMIAAIVIAIGILAVAGMHVAAMKGNTTGRDVSIGMAVGYGKLAELRSLNYYLDVSNATNPSNPPLIVDPRLSEGEYEDHVNSSGNCPDDANDCIYHIQWTISNEGNQHAPGAMKKVNISVSWPSPDVAGGGGVATIQLPESTIAIGYR